MDTTPPPVAVTSLAGRPGDRVLVVGPSLGTRVETLWGPAAEGLARENRLHVVGWDLPGHGTSPAAPRGFSLGQLAEGVLAALDRALAPASREPAWFVAGDSVGGAVSLLLLLGHPERFAAGAVLCSSAKFGASQGWADRAALVRSEGMAPMVASAPARWFGTRVAAHPTMQSTSVVAELHDVDPEGYAQVCDAIGGYDLTSDLGRIPAPLLLVAGSDDVATPAEGMADLAGAVPGGQLRILSGVGHLAPLEDPAGTTALLGSHFRACGPS